MMRSDQSTRALVRSAIDGDESAWAGIVRQYEPLVRSVCRRHGLAGATAEDVDGVVWLRLVEGLRTIREPGALPGWLARVTQRECQTQRRRRDREVPTDGLDPASSAAPETDERLLRKERGLVVRAALASLPERDRRLISMLFSDPPTPYAEISAALDMPVGAIGPTRQRCLARLRRCPSLVGLLTASDTPVVARAG